MEQLHIWKSWRGIGHHCPMHPDISLGAHSKTVLLLLYLLGVVSSYSSNLGCFELQYTNWIRHIWLLQSHESMADHTVSCFMVRTMYFQHTWMLDGYTACKHGTGLSFGLTCMGQHCLLR
ncbi:unnamed protein product [Sphagnum balticum]